MTDTHAIDATALEALAKRVEAGEAGREIDAEIWILLRSDEEYSKALRRVQEPSGCPDPHGEVAKWARGGWFAHKYSTSLDAVAALAERVLPGWNYSVEQSGRLVGAAYWAWASDRHDLRMAPTECAARLAAILRAKAKDQTNDRPHQRS
tara:strand:- start:2484 stop:2933 length:450 start_codon:yes stop_codon:yes gene_type:complete